MPLPGFWTFDTNLAGLYSLARFSPMKAGFFSRLTAPLALCRKSSTLIINSG